MGSVTRRTRILSRLLLPVVIVALPLVLLLSSVRTFQELDEQKALYLRNRVAMLAGRLENLPASETGTAAFEQLSEDEPNLMDLELIERGKAGDQPRLQPIWDGQELFRTGFINAGEEPVYRAYVPFHSSAGLRIARIDLDGRAADFLVVHARHNVIVASLARSRSRGAVVVRDLGDPAGGAARGAADWSWSIWLTWARWLPCWRTRFAIPWGRSKDSPSSPARRRTPLSGRFWNRF